MKYKEFFILTIILILVLTNTFFIYQNFALKEKVNQLLLKPKSNFNEKVLNFLDLFIGEVLKAEKEIDYNTKIKIENAILQIEDKEILSQWNKFISSRSERDAQVEVKNLLEILVKKVRVD